MSFQKYIFYSGAAALFCFLVFLLLLLLFSLLPYNLEVLLFIPIVTYFIVSTILFLYTLYPTITPFRLFVVILIQILSGIAAFYGAAIIELNIFLHHIDETGTRLVCMIYGIQIVLNYLVFFLIPRKDSVDIEQEQEP